MSSIQVCSCYDSFQESLKNSESFEKVVLQITEQYDTTESRKALDKLKEIATNPKAELRLTIDDDELELVKSGGLNQFSEQELSVIKSLKVASSDKDVLTSVLKLTGIKEVEVKDQGTPNDIGLTFVFESNESTKVTTAFDQLFLSAGESFSKLNKLTLNTTVNAILNKFKGTAEQEWNTLVEQLSKDAASLVKLEVQFLNFESQVLSTSVVSQGLSKILSSPTSNIKNADIFNYSADNLDQELLNGLKESKSVVNLTVFDKHFKQVVSSVLVANKTIKNVVLLSTKNTVPVECVEFVKNTFTVLNEFASQINLDSLVFRINVENVDFESVKGSLTGNYPVSSIKVVNTWNGEQVLLQV